MRRAAFFALLAVFLLQARAQDDSDLATAREGKLRDTLAVMSRSKDVEPSAWDALVIQFDDYQKVADSSETLVALRRQQLALAKRFPDQARYRALLEQLAENPFSAVAEMAREQRDVLQRQEDLKTKPVDLKFTAVDGSLVDLASMQGKVVVVDFWASWCVECAFTAKTLSTVYRDLRGEGLEVVGVSLDEDRAAMEGFARKYGMTWPQSFEGRKWDNSIARSYGINALPAFWLIDKKGMLVADKEPKNLAAEVKRLLAEP